MPIKNKDGTVYQLRGPNPLLDNQENWDRAAVKLINLGFKSEIVADERNPIKEEQSNIIDIKEELNLKNNETKTIQPQEFIKEIQQSVPISEPEPELIVVPEPEKPKNTPTVLTVDNRIAKIFKDRGVEYYCAPVIDYKLHNDDLYGDSYKTPIYGEPFVFDAVIIDSSELQLQIWCVRAITKDSIVYQKKKDNEWERRWWRIYSIQPKTGGFLCLANISDTNPSFEN